MASATGRREGRKAPKPYFDTAPATKEDARTKLNELVGFDVAETLDRFWDWFPAHRYGKVEVIRAAANPHLRRKPDSDGNITLVVDVSLPAQMDQNAADLKKANALLDAIQSPGNLVTVSR